MFFTAKKLATDQTLTKFYAKRKAKQAIILFQMKASDIRLDNFCRQHFKLPLKNLCLYLIDTCIVQTSSATNTITICWLKKDLADIASLITFGNHEINGSRILRIAFALILL